MATAGGEPCATIPLQAALGPRSGWLLPVSSADPQAPIPALQSPGHPLKTARERTGAVGTQHPVPACTGMPPQCLVTNIFLVPWAELGSFPIPLG